MEKKKVNISYACPIKWDTMQSLDDKTKFCGSCKMKVQDFTKETNLNTAGVHCGRFRMDQIGSLNSVHILSSRQVLTLSLFSLLGMTAPVLAQNTIVNIPSKSITTVLQKDFTLKGNVKHSKSSESVEGVEIIVSNSVENLYSTKTDSLGNFSIELTGYSVLDGDLKIRFIKDGYSATTINSKDISRGNSIAEISILPNSQSVIIKELTVRGGTTGTLIIDSASLSGKVDHEIIKTNYRQ